MDKQISYKIFENQKILNHFKENSYYIKYLNRDPKYYKTFLNDMKILYKERVTDKISDTIDNVEMVSEVIDTIK